MTAPILRQGERTTPTGALILAYAIIYLAWGSTYLGIRIAVAGIPPFLLAGARFLSAGAVLYSFLRVRGREPAALWGADTWIVGLCLVGGNAIVSWAEERVPSNLSALAVGTAPFFMVLFQWLLGSGARPNRVIALGLALGAVGLVVLFGPGAFPAGSRPPAVRIVALIVSTIVWTLGSVYSKRTGQKSDPLWSATAQMLAGGALMFFLGLLLGEGRGVRLAAAGAASWLAFTYLTVAGSMVAYPTYIWLLKHSTPVRVSTYAYVNPLVALFLGWLVLGETLPLRMAFAVPILIGGVLLITYAGARRSGVLRGDQRHLAEQS